MFKKIFFFLLLFSSIAFSQEQKLSPSTEVSIFTCGRGDQLYSTFGHTALRVKDDENQLDVVYNYGAFDFRTENFYLKFVKGDLQYFMTATSVEDFIMEYQMDEREVIEQKLNLSLEKKQELFEHLNTNLFSTEKYYTYKFIDKNCTTMVADKINGLFNGKLIEKVDDKSISYRELLYPYFDDYFWYKLGINIIFGAKTDAKAEKLFLPVELLNSLDKAKVDGKLLVSKKEIIIKGKDKPTSFSFFNSIFFIITLLLLIIVINKRILSLSYLFACGLLGIFLCLVGFYSEHQEILWNYNALLFSPLFILLPFVKGNIFKKIIDVNLILLLVYILFIFTKPYLVLMIPFILSSIYILLKLKKKSQEKLLSSVK
jgi:hypothetical protein